MQAQRPAICSNPYRVQFALCIAVFLVPFMGSSLNLAMPLVVQDFALSAFTLTFLISGYLVGTTMFQMPAARLADLVGKRRLYLIGISVFGFFTLMCGLAWSGPTLIMFRFLSGVGSALVFATNMAILTAVFPKERRGRALGINTAVVYFAVAAGPFLGGLLAQHFGWRSIFYVSAFLTLMAIVTGATSIKDEWIEGKGEPYDYAGSGIYAAAIACVVMGFSHLPLMAGWILLAVGFIAGAVFVRLQLRSTYPMLRLEIFAQNRHFRLSSLSAMINYSASFAIGFILSLYLQYVLGLPPDQAGLVLIAQPVTQCILSPLGGRLSDRINPSTLTTSGMGLIATGLFMLAWLNESTPVYHVTLILVMVGVGFAMFSSPNVNIIMGSVSSKLSGLASATTGTARQLGQSLSIATTSLIVHHYMGDMELSLETAGLYLPAMHTGFLIFAAVCVVGMYTSASKLMGGGNSKEWRHVSGRLEAREGE
ncbi:MAG: MFS transporter [Planctomycetaceae bacterium]|nr:MFS transporter [Planctomycetaceae bacterium]